MGWLNMFGLYIQHLSESAPRINSFQKFTLKSILKYTTALLELLNLMLKQYAKHMTMKTDTITEESQCFSLL